MYSHPTPKKTSSCLILSKGQLTLSFFHPTTLVSNKCMGNANYCFLAKFFPLQLLIYGNFYSPALFSCQMLILETGVRGTPYKGCEYGKNYIKKKQDMDT